jgi:endoglucanase
VLSGAVGARTGEWNAGYQAVYSIDLSALRRPGSYRVRVSGSATALSPAFRVAPAARLFGAIAADNVKFFQVQRDGADIVRGILDRKPSHLADRRATVYDTPVFKGDGGDEIAAPLKPVGGPVDVEGGWFDAGDFVKFTHATAYSLSELLYTQRDLRRGDEALAAESRVGLKWLDKMWDERTGTLYAQVGIGTGSEEFNFLGDHDVWRLPEADDALQVKPGDPEYFIKHRPVFRASAPGGLVSPNLAGRVAASFALAAQLEAKRNPRLARHYLNEGASIFALAKTTDVGELITAFPHAYYPEDSWQDDLEFGAVQLALAGRALGDRRSAAWLRAAVHWAHAYLGSEHLDTLNLYDTSALGHADLIRLLCAAGRSSEARALVADLRRQLDSGVAAAHDNVFGNAADTTNFDVATRSLGFVATAQLYRSVTGDRRYDRFATQQRNFVLGANPWGTTLVIGAGTTFPHCPQHQVANLAGSLNGGRNVVVGAVVNGPNGADNFEFIGIPDGANACPTDGINPFARYDTAESRYLDDVRAWPSSEPAIDFTSTGMLAFHLQSRG